MKMIISVLCGVHPKVACNCLVSWRSLVTYLKMASMYSCGTVHTMLKYQWYYSQNGNVLGMCNLIFMGGFFTEYFGNLSTQGEKIILCKKRLNPHKVRMKQTLQRLKNLEKLKIPVWPQMTFGNHLWSYTILMAIFNDSHYKKLRKGSLSLLTESRHRLVTKTKHSTFGSIFNFNILLAIFDGSHY